ncbi:DNA mismatch repair protein MutS [Anaerotignum lactatifermentans]|uniref:DNA mismatch repair protein MutS n=1 Tax=Anaerotignum lactatifermentans TaxID=160404 RepID=A0ABS2G8X0_9FIRM|nr:DNA mismatch repair protein MutS [Anaerotignum lactatifermentans]MBM6828512.1 DNA mismatch repair protein MutS [Anaerotignum lactatifermentans]MBM6877919.1 DNA mismatch repair protein MutS [Anaerotignum lactatifermentans]MBM6950094.1 DNA mismatch repair protein MutS [Anaerotignum lactatifermentans]
MAKITPMMQQYFAIKENYKHCLLFFRLGDFYEMFFEDAVIASKELEITLTGKDWGQEERAPMCGVPFHSADGYIARLVEKGYKVAICEQVEDPKLAKGIVKRDVIRVITPGTLLDQSVLDESKNNYIMAVYGEKSGYGLAVCDVTTGEFQTTQFPTILAASKILDEIARFSPAELICNEGLKEHPLAEEIKKRFQIYLNDIDERMFSHRTAKKTLEDHFHVASLDGFGLEKKPQAISAAGGLMWYLLETQKNGLEHISAVKYYTTGDFMPLDVASRRNLELTETMREKNKRGSLLGVLDETKTAMGARMMRKWVEQPLLQAEEIRKRLDGVEELKNDLFLREEIKDVLRTMYDFERIMSRVVYQNANARDLAMLKNSIANLPLLKNILMRCKSGCLRELYEKLDPLENIHELIEKAIVEDPPFTVREGGMIREGYCDELDTYSRAKKEGTSWIHQMEEEEREKTGIKNLKIRYNKVFGYYLEVTKSNLEDVPDNYIRKQTLANCERFITPELNDLAELILGSEEKIVSLEYDLFTEIRNAVAAEVERIQFCAHIISELDVLQSLAEVASSRNYVKPVVDDGDVIDIKGGRHPVVEKLMDGQFIPNDTYLDNDETRLAIITGPNMAGKSTYMRQTALIVLMAQMGSFVPADSAHIGIVDRIFTRVGASDDLSAGQSTFMVEMTEVANILHNATSKSLLILDEIGRGTSTFDGLSIAWAVLEYVADPKVIGAKTLFATHYHELSELEGKLAGVKNYCVAVQEQGEDIIFLRKIKRGGADHSYGVQVARLAGLPNKVIKRSNQILKQLNAADITKKAKRIAAESREQAEETAQQVDMFHLEETQMLEEIKKLDIMAMTPMEALQKLFDLQKRAKGM